MIVNSIDWGLMFGLAKTGSKDRNCDSTLTKIYKVVDALGKKMKAEEFFRVTLTNNYVGEFFERHEERGIVLDDKTFSTMALYFAMGFNSFSEREFNDYQIKDFKQLIEEKSPNIDNPLLDFALYILGDETALDKMLAKKLSLTDFCFVLRISFDILKDKNLTKKFLTNYEYLMETPRVFINNLELVIEIIILASNKDILDKDNKTFNAFVKAIDGKLSQKGVVKHLNELGFTNSHIECINFLIKRFICYGDLKIQKQLLSTLQHLVTLETSYDELELLTLSTILSFRKFNVKMEAGLVTSLGSMILYHDLQNKIVNLDNFKTFVSKVVDNNIISINDFRINILTDDNFKYKIETLSSVDNRCSVIKDHITRNIMSIRSKTKDETTETNDIFTLLTRIENAFEFNIIELFKNGSKWSTTREDTYIALCELGVYDALEHLMNNVVRNNFTAAYFLKNTTREKYLAAKFLYENNGDVTSIISSSLLDRKIDNPSAYGEKYGLFLNNISNEEQKEYLDLLSEAILLKGISSFNTFFLNLMLSYDKVKSIYTSEEIKDLYKCALEIAKCFDSYSYYSSSRYDSKYATKELNAMYMSEEEKLAIAEERKRLAEEKEKEEKRILNENTKAKIVETMNSENFFNESSYARYSKIRSNVTYLERETPVYKETVKAILLEAKIFAHEIQSYFEVIGNLVKQDFISLDIAKQTINSIKIIEVVSNENDNDEEVA